MNNIELEAYLNEILNADAIPDESLNGLQVEGKSEIRKVAFAVSACEEAFSKAASADADALIVHHGLFWKNKGAERIRGLLLGRLKPLILNGLNLYAYHLPLDAHPSLGNNAKAARELGLGNVEPFCDYHGTLIGVSGAFPAPVPVGEAVAMLERFYGHEATALLFGRKIVSTVGIVSGGAPNEVKQAAEKGLDLYVTGEASEPVYYVVNELGMNMASLGHYATERIGVMALMDHAKDVLGLDTFFVELNNPL